MASGGKPVFQPTKENCIYTRCYCEENIWQLCRTAKESGFDLNQFFVIFISNNNKCVPIWQQQAAKSPDLYVMWDYHVILVYKAKSTDDQSLVYDLDTRLPFPCSFQLYVEKSIGSEVFIVEQYHRLFRVVPSSVFLDTFASDRSHMLKEDNTWLAAPPTYPCIKTNDCDNNLQDFISMDSNILHGKVMSLEEFCLNFHDDELFSNLLSLIKL